MKKRLKILIPAMVFSIIGIMICMIVIKLVQENKITKQIQNLPPFAFNYLNSDEIFTDSDLVLEKALLITFFHPECDFCHIQLDEISKNLEKFSSFQILFISHAETGSIISLASKYKLMNEENIVFLEDRAFIFEQIFGKSSLPASFIYSAQGKLLKQFKGQVNVKILLEYLNN